MIPNCQENTPQPTCVVDAGGPKQFVVVSVLPVLEAFRIPPTRKVVTFAAVKLILLSHAAPCPEVTAGGVQGDALRA